MKKFLMWEFVGVAIHCDVMVAQLFCTVDSPSAGREEDSPNKVDQFLFQ